MTEFLTQRGLLSPLTAVMPFCCEFILEFYANLCSNVSAEGTAKFGRVFIRNKIYEFNPTAIDDFYNTTVENDEDPRPNIHTVTSILTGGMLNEFPDHTKKLFTANLTSFYFMLHKTHVQIWTPSTNSTVVPDLRLLFCTQCTENGFNFEKIVFNTVLQFADGGLKSTKLPYPSLINGISESQGFTRNPEGELFVISNSLKNATTYIKEII